MWSVTLAWRELGVLESYSGREQGFVKCYIPREGFSKSEVLLWLGELMECYIGRGQGVMLGTQMDCYVSEMVWQVFGG